MSSNTANNDAGSDRNNVYPSLLSSNNFNPYTVSPYAPLTANQGGDNHNPQVDTISSYTNPTIQVLANMNIANGRIFTINKQQILPNQLTDGITSVTVTGNSGIGSAEFVLRMQGTDILAISAVEGTFQNYNIADPFTLNVKGQTNTQTLAVGPTVVVPSGYVVNVVGNVLVNGNISSSGTFDISGLQVENLGVKTLLDVSGQSHLYGLVTAQNGINVTGNSYILGNVGIQTTTPTQALDVAGTIHVSNNLDVSGNAHITGNTAIQGNLDVCGAIAFTNVSATNAHIANILSVSGEIDLTGPGALNITGATIGQTVMEINGVSNFYNDVNINGAGQLKVNTTIGGAQFSLIQPTLVIGGTVFAPAEPDTALEVYGLSLFFGSAGIQGGLDVSGQTDTSGLYVKHNLDVSGNLTVDGTTTFGNATFQNQYIQNKLDVSGQTDTSGLYVKHNLDVSGNLTVDGTTTFANATFLNQYIQNKLDVSGQTDVSGLYVYNNLDVSGNLTVDGTTTFANATFQNQYIQNKLDVSGQTDTSGLYVYNNLDVSGNINIQGNTNIQGTTNYRIQVLDVSATITDISNQPTMYVVDCGGAAPTIVLTGVTGSPLKVGVTYYFIAKNTAGNLQITYNSLDGPVTTAGVPAPLLTILVCVNYDGTDNFFSAST